MTATNVAQPATHDPLQTYEYIGSDTEQSALGVQSWILHLASRVSDCRCTICVTTQSTGEHHD